AQKEERRERGREGAQKEKRGREGERERENLDENRHSGCHFISEEHRTRKRTRKRRDFTGILCLCQSVRVPGLSAAWHTHTHTQMGRDKEREREKERDIYHSRQTGPA